MSKLIARFMTTLQAQRAGDGQAGDGQAGAWELTAALIFYSAVLERVVVVPAGFRTDYASVPRLPVAYLLFGGVAEEAAVVHDYLYTNLVDGVTREQADNVFAEALKVLGVPSWRRGPMWAAVRAFGKKHWGSGTPLKLVEPTAEQLAENGAD